MTVNREEIRILLKQSPQATEIMDALTAGMSVNARKRIDGDGTFMALYLECIGKCNLGHIFSLTQCYERYCDSRHATEMNFINAEDGGYYPAEIWQDPEMRHGVGVLIKKGNLICIDETEQANITEFAEVWLRKIWQQQGLGEAL